MAKCPRGDEAPQGSTIAQEHIQLKKNESASGADCTSNAECTNSRLEHYAVTACTLTREGTCQWKRTDCPRIPPHTIPRLAYELRSCALNTPLKERKNLETGQLIQKINSPTGSSHPRGPLIRGVDSPTGSTRPRSIRPRVNVPGIKQCNPVLN